MLLFKCRLTADLTFLFNCHFDILKVQFVNHILCQLLLFFFNNNN